MTKRVYITGGSSGIGLALAQFYAMAGDDVVLLARNPGKLDDAVNTCRRASVRPEQAIAAESLDITAYDSLQGQMDGIVQRHGLPDLLILSAGIAHNDKFLDTPRAVFDSVVDTNLAGSREVARAVLPAMIARGSGQVAFVSSMAGLLGIYGYSAYTASKFAVTGLAQVLRQELLGTGVSVNLVCPPEVATPMIAAEAGAILPQTRFLKDLAGTLSPEAAASGIARGLSRNRALIVPGFRPGVIAWIARHCPGLFSKTWELLLRSKF
jgi:3-dehydrosphinganine reductase